MSSSGSARLSTTSGFSEISVSTDGWGYVFSRGWTFLASGRSEEHTSELQSQSNLVCRLLLEKKKSKTPHRAHQTRNPTHSSGGTTRAVVSHPPHFTVRHPVAWGSLSLHALVRTTAPTSDTAT